MSKQSKKTINVYVEDWETISKWAIESQASNAEIINMLVICWQAQDKLDATQLKPGEQIKGEGQ